MSLNKNNKIFVAGHTGMVGSSILRLLKRKKYQKIYTIKSSKLNLLNQQKTLNYLKKLNQIML